MGKNYSPELEEVIQAKIIQSSDAFSIAQGFLEPMSFGHPSSKIVWRVFESLSDRGIEINGLTVANHLDSLGQLNIVSSDLDNSIRGGEYIRHLSSLTGDFSKTSIEGLCLQLQNIAAQRDIREFLVVAKEKIDRGEDAVSVLSYLEQENGRVSLVTGAKTHSISTLGMVGKNIGDEYLDAKTSGGRYMKSGLWVFDNLIGGFYPGRLYLVLGTSGTGKSLITHNILYNISIEGVYNKRLKETKRIQTGLITMEQGDTEVGKRFVQMLSGINGLDIEEGSISDANIPKFEQALETFRDLKRNIFFDDSPSLTLPQLRAKIRKMVHDGAKLIVVDQLDEVKLVGTQKSYTDNDTKGFAIKEYGREFDVPILLPHQFKKSAGNAERKGVTNVNLSDANEGGEKGVDIAFAPRYDENGNYLIFLKVRQSWRGVQDKPYRMDFDLDRIMYSNYTGNERDIPKELSGDIND